MFLDRHGHFFRTRTRHNVAVARRYLRGLAQAEDCTFESMAAVVEGGCAQQFQHFISCSPWDHEPVVAQIGQDADRLLGGKPTSALIIDESSFPKQGDRSVGVARQWTGRLGKIDNCQVAVFGVLADGERHTPIDARLYLPERWIEDPARCERAGIPEAAREKMSKSELALDIVRRARARGIRFAWVGVDGGYGKEPDFLRRLDDENETFVADVHRNQRIWTKEPGLHVPASKPGRGRPSKKQKPATASITVEKLAEGIPPEDWTRCILRDCTRGQLRVDITTRRILGLGRQGRASAMLASDRPARGWIGQDDQIQPLERLRRYAAAPTGPDAGAALLGRARFRRRQRRVRPRRLSGAGMAAMASPRHDGDVGDAVHSGTARGPATGPGAVDAARHR